MKSSREKFIKILEKLKIDSEGPDGIWQLNYSHWNNANFFKGRVFSYWYEGVMPNNLECLEAIRNTMIAELDRDWETISVIPMAIV